MFLIILLNELSYIYMIINVIIHDIDDSLLIFNLFYLLILKSLEIVLIYIYIL